MSEFTFVIGAGPAGLTAAYELARNGQRVQVVEKTDTVGGISRTEEKDGYRFDIGGHRFFSKVPEITQLWHDVLGEAFMKVPRMSRIFYGGKYYDYPLSAMGTLRNLGAFKSMAILLSYCRAKLQPIRPEQTFEEWVVNRFGRRLFDTFFKAYTEKVWGIGCDKINAEWAAQRIKGLSLRAAAMNAVFGAGDAKTLIKEFDYPRFGPGQMWERFRDKVEERGNAVDLETDVVAIHHDGHGRATGVTIRRGGVTERIEADHIINSMPLTTMLQRLDPPPPQAVLDAAAKLTYRDFILVGVIVERADLFPDNWIYIHEPGVRVGRIQNFKNWSPHMVPDATKTSLGLEYFCTRGDDLWTMPEADLYKLACRETAKLGLAQEHEVHGLAIIRQPKAYPVYDNEYADRLDVIRNYLDTFANLQTVGRNGMHRYNNQDHSMLTGLLAAKNVMGERHDLWDVNVERSYHESTAATPQVKPGSKTREAINA